MTEQKKRPSKFSWGKAIIMTYVVFVLGIGFLVYTSVTKTIDLVTPNYYEKEIRYQQQIDKINNTGRLENKLTTNVIAGNFVIVFPDDSIGGCPLTGEVTFYRPSDAKKDFKLPLSPGLDMKQIIDTEKLEKGLWKVSIDWNKDGIDYYSEEKIVIQ
jgi:hypothetical protein